MRTDRALLIASLLLVACGRNSPTALEGSQLELVTVVQTSSSGFDALARTTVRSASEWSNTWTTLYARQNPAPALPAIDFANEMAVVAATGTRSNGCFAITVTQASVRNDGSPEFEVIETVPGPACACTQAETQPVHVVRVARIPGSARFVERTVVNPC